MMLHAATTRGYDGGQFDAGPHLMHARTIYEDLQDAGSLTLLHQICLSDAVGRSLLAHSLARVLSIFCRCYPLTFCARQDFTTAHAITPLSSSANTSAFIMRDIAFTKFFEALDSASLPSYTVLVRISLHRVLLHRRIHNGHRCCRYQL
jgi:hypothetical protein